MADIAIDLGTANTLIQVKGAGIVLNEPSVVALDGAGRLVAAGLEAKRMLGRTPHGVRVVRPMRDGVIADVDAVEAMLRHYLDRVVRPGILRSRPRAIIGVPSGITELERRAVRQAVLGSGAREVFLIAEPMAAAIGVGLPVNAPRGSLIVNVGGGTTEIGVIALSGLVAQNSVRVAGNEMDDALVAVLRRHYSLLIGDSTAESIKMQIGSAMPLEEERAMNATGRDLVSGTPASVEITSREVRDWIEEPIRAIEEAVRHTLELSPPELAADLVDNGMVLTGGSSLLRGLDQRLAEVTGLPVSRDPEPMTCVVRGAGRVLEDWAEFRGTLSAT